VERIYLEILAPPTIPLLPHPGEDWGQPNAGLMARESFKKTTQR
jgi:hypothetical protein